MHASNDSLRREIRAVIHDLYQLERKEKWKGEKHSQAEREGRLGRQLFCLMAPPWSKGLFLIANVDWLPLVGSAH